MSVKETLWPRKSKNGSGANSSRKQKKGGKSGEENGNTKRVGEKQDIKKEDLRLDDFNPNETSGNRSELHTKETTSDQ